MTVCSTSIKLNTGYAQCIHVKHGYNYKRRCVAIKLKLTPIISVLLVVILLSQPASGLAPSSYNADEFDEFVKSGRFSTAVLSMSNSEAYRSKIVTTCLAEMSPSDGSYVKNEGGVKFWDWWLDETGVDVHGADWCACFVSWAYAQVFDDMIGGNVTNQRYPSHYNCNSLVAAYKRMNRLVSISDNYTPRPGDLVFWGDGGTVRSSLSFNSSHVGIVWKLENGVLYTLEGNTGNACKVNKYDYPGDVYWFNDDGSVSYSTGRKSPVAFGVPNAPGEETFYCPDGVMVAY